MTDVDQLLERIDALQALLACYRLGTQPRDALLTKLDRTGQHEEAIRQGLDKEISR